MNLLWAMTTVFAIMLLSLLLKLKINDRKKRRINGHCKDLQTKKIQKQIHEIRELIDQSKIQVPWQLEKTIIESDVCGLIDMLNFGKVTSQQLMVTFMSRCIKMGIKMNAITDFNHFEAFKMAKHCDDTRTNLLDKGELPPLYGIPISLKNNFIQKDFDTSLAMVQFYDSVHKQDGLIVRILKDAGAIPFVRTNLPVGVIGNENHNHIYGSVLSPWRKDRTPGGSSGGESALISSGCSPLGFATDAAGSIRTPALFCGLYGFMISPRRVSLKGTHGLGVDSRGWEIGSIGPICKSTRDASLVTKLLVSSEKMKEDSTILFRPWSLEGANLKRKYRIGFLNEDMYFTWTRAQKRVYKQVVDHLKRAGHEVCLFEYQHWPEAVASFLKIAGNTLKDRVHLLEDNYIKCESELILKSSKFPDWTIKLLRWSISKLGKKFQRADQALKAAVRLPESELLKLIDFHKSTILEVETVFDSQKLDALIIPGLNVAYNNLTSHKLAATHGAHIFANSVEMCSGVIPIDLMRPEEENHEDQFNDMWTSILKKTLKDGAGLPLGVQICSKNGFDEVCLNVMQEIEREFSFKKIIYDL